MIYCFVAVITVRTTRQVRSTNTMLVCVGTRTMAQTKLRESGAIQMGNITFRLIYFRRSGAEEGMIALGIYGALNKLSVQKLFCLWEGPCRQGPID